MSRSRKTTSASKPPKVKRTKIRDVFVARPFAGLSNEVDWVALRELIPAATATVKLKPEVLTRRDLNSPEQDGREVLVATVLPLAWPAMVRTDGQILLGLQTQFHSGDVSRDLAAALVSALETEPGNPVAVPALAVDGPRLQDLLVDEPLTVELRETFDFWVPEAGPEDDADAIAQSVEQANQGIHPTVALDTPGAYWCEMGDKSFVRWVLPDDESDALNALARLAGSGPLTLGENTRLAGMFRAHGLLIPVWEVPTDAPAESWQEPLRDVEKRYADALTGPDLTSAERRAKQGLIARQLTIR